MTFIQFLLFSTSASIPQRDKFELLQMLQALLSQELTKISVADDPDALALRHFLSYFCGTLSFVLL